MLIDMAKIFRRAANKVKNSRDGHGSLGLLIFNEKVVYESFQKIVMAQAQASISMLKWAKNEDNLAIQDVFSKVFEVSSMWTAVWRDFNQEYFKYRKSFKDILKDEKVLDEARKQEAMHASKMSKVQKQIDQTKRKSDGARPHSITNEMVEVIAQAEKEQAELEVKTTKHEIMKAQKLRESIHQISDGLKQWASKTLLVAEAYDKLATLITDTPTQLTENKVFHGAGKSRSIVNGLGRDLYIDPELSKHLATMSHSVPSYLYAVSASNLSDKQNGAKYDYVDFSSEDNSGMVNVNVVYHKGLPEPWHYQQLKPREKFEVDLNQRRPLSLTDLRPPPTLPPPPVPKNAKQTVFRTKSAQDSLSRKINFSGAANAIPLKPSGENNWYASTNISSDSDSDGEGYVEPYTDPTFVEQKALWKVLSDGAINRVGRQYDDKESATHLYHHLDKNTYHSEGFSNDSEPASYVDLIPS